MINVAISGRLIDAIYALVTASLDSTPVEPKGAVEAVEAVETPKPKSRKKVDHREHVAVTRDPVEAVEAVADVEARIEPIKAVEARIEPIKAVEAVEAVAAVEVQIEPIKAVEAVEAVAPAAPAVPAAPIPVKDAQDPWPSSLTKPAAWDYDAHGAAWRAANQIGTAELGAALQKVYVDHSDIIKMPSVRVAMSKLGVEGWWLSVAKNIYEARDASNKPLDITPKDGAKDND